MPPSTQVSLWEDGVGGEWVCRCEEKRGQQAPRGREPVPVEHSSWGWEWGQPRYSPATEAQGTPLGAKPKDEALWPFFRRLLMSIQGRHLTPLPSGVAGGPDGPGESRVWKGTGGGGGSEAGL